MKKILFLFVLVVLPAALQAATYLYKGRTDYVRIEKVPRGLRQLELAHPVSFSDEKIREVLGAFRYSKRHALSTQVEYGPIFNAKAVEFLAPYVREAFSRMEKNQVLHLVYVDHHAQSILRDHTLVACRFYVVDHFLYADFLKLHSNLEGDYQRRGGEYLINDSREVGIELKFPEGISPAASGDGAIAVLDLTHDFSKVEDKAPHASQIVQKTKINKVDKTAPVGKTASPEKTVKERLAELKKLREEELITEKEYQRKRRELIDQL